ncbi:MAG TPA: group III truncated hemoglobin [Verrucomicrobiae bacterium]|nr:group III truncated hemoglobin [Verrucomicrobiae bacterium]
MRDTVNSLYERLGGHDGILKLIKTFYVDVRQHAVIGPIFNSRIHDWPAHLDKIADFWALQADGPTRYRGGFAGAHMALGLEAEHFQHWLGLWELNNGRHLAAREAAELNAIAHELGRRLYTVTRNRLPFSGPPS